MSIIGLIKGDTRSSDYSSYIKALGITVLWNPEGHAGFCPSTIECRVQGQTFKLEGLGFEVQGIRFREV